MADILIDRDPPGCHCTASCEFPCWQRVGLTSDPCCKQCAPIEEPMTAEDIAYEKAQNVWKAS
jgi:hypothetical protein